MNWKKWIFGFSLWLLSLVWFGFETNLWAAGALAGVTAGAVLSMEAEL